MKYWKVFTAAFLMCAVLMMTAPQQAQASDLYRENTAADAMMEKLGRGLVNILTGWIEIPKQIAKAWRETDPFTGLVVGTIKGIGYGFTRTLVGVYETVTFPFPVPRDYKPLMYPEYILPSIWGEPLPFMDTDYTKDDILEIH